MSLQDAFPEYFGHCLRAHDKEHAVFVEVDENWDSTYECLVCGDQWTEYEG